MLLRHHLDLQLVPRALRDYGRRPALLAAKSGRVSYGRATCAGHNQECVKSKPRNLAPYIRNEMHPEDFARPAIS